MEQDNKKDQPPCEVSLDIIPTSCNKATINFRSSKGAMSVMTINALQSELVTLKNHVGMGNDSTIWIVFHKLLSTFARAPLLDLITSKIS